MTEHTRRRRAAATLAVATILTGAIITAPALAAQTDRTAQLTRLAEQDVDAGAPGVIVRVDDGTGSPIDIDR
jgi:D-alanyl-D-alanine carboxypeptidase